MNKEKNNVEKKNIIKRENTINYKRINNGKNGCSPSMRNMHSDTGSETTAHRLQQIQSKTPIIAESHVDFANTCFHASTSYELTKIYVQYRSIQNHMKR